MKKSSFSANFTLYDVNTPIVSLSYPMSGHCQLEFQLEVFGFLPTTHAATNANKLHPQSLHAVWHFKRVYLHACSIYTPDKMLFFFDRGKNASDPPIGALCHKYSAGCGISSLHLWL